MNYIRRDLMVGLTNYDFGLEVGQLEVFTHPSGRTIYTMFSVKFNSGEMSRVLPTVGINVTSDLLMPDCISDTLHQLHQPALRRVERLLDADDLGLLTQVKWQIHRYLRCLRP